MNEERDRTGGDRFTVEEAKALSDMLTRARRQVIERLSDGQRSELLLALDDATSVVWALAAEDDGTVLEALRWSFSQRD
jgi:hypothetical protein